MIRVAVIGSAGQLGTDLVRLLGRSGAYQVFPLGHSDLECTEPDSVRQALGAISPNVVVNCAAYVRVDDCEDRPKSLNR